MDDLDRYIAGLTDEERCRIEQAEQEIDRLVGITQSTDHNEQNTLGQQDITDDGEELARSFRRFHDQIAGLE